MLHLLLACHVAIVHDNGIFCLTEGTLCTVRVAIIAVVGVSQYFLEDRVLAFGLQLLEAAFGTHFG